MINNCGTKKVKYLILFIYLLLLSNTLVPLLFNWFQIESNFNISDNSNNNSPKINDFSKEDYNPIIEEQKHGLGNITIYDMDLNQVEIGFYIFNKTYPLLWEDYNSDALNITFKEIRFVETIEPAKIDNLNDEYSDRQQITVKLNETLDVWYNESKEGYLIYGPRLNPCNLIELYIFNGTDIIKLTVDTDYYIDGDNFLVFDYDNYFQIEPEFNFTMYLIWEYNLTINPWTLNQISTVNLNMTKAEKNFTIEFNYEFTLRGRMNNKTIKDSIFSDAVIVALNVNLPDKDLLGNHTLLINNETVDIGDHLNLDKSINITLSDSFSGNKNELSLNFTSIFTVKFIEPVYKTWAIDRLIAYRDIRERIYFPTIISGPLHIYITFISIFEPSISPKQVLSADSLFEREVLFFEKNITAIGDKGLRVELPYMIKGEICPINIRYTATHTLRIIIFDNIKMPVVGLKVLVYYYNKSYGTYISNTQIQPIAPLKTNENGEVRLKNVPNGNYTVEVYQHGKLITRTNVSTYNEINYIYTNIIHIPIWILIFGTINGSFLIIGIIFYIKNKKSR
ncbi:MAG: carboxypeptidase-like regulatory domain-containing protein [Promethearchaeota archaeon]